MQASDIVGFLGGTSKISPRISSLWPTPLPALTSAGIGMLLWVEMLIFPSILVAVIAVSAEANGSTVGDTVGTSVEINKLEGGLVFCGSGITGMFL